MPNPHDAQIADVACYLLPITFRVPLKFGHQVMREVWCARACIRLRGNDGRIAEGWGETPYSIGWAWPSDLPYAEREKAMNDFAASLATDLKGFETTGHAIEIGEAYQKQRLTTLRESFARNAPVYVHCWVPGSAGGFVTVRRRAARRLRQTARCRCLHHLQCAVHE